MRYIGKKIALGCLAGVLAATGLTGCSSKMDGSSVAVTVNGEQVPLGVVSFMTRYQQAQTQAMYEMYFGGANDGLWDQVSDEKTGETYGESARDDVVEQVE
ncbi:MAG: FKBP-type peptidylprolyl isomerase, partial [Lachnospiraceae bacterium]|nr:FKBP-type peptidylprolyl isomerase [Lachnospiraceae bacterium]